MRTNVVNPCKCSTVSVLGAPKKWLENQSVKSPKENVNRRVLLTLCLFLLFPVKIIAAEITYQRQEFKKNYDRITSGKKYDFARLSSGLKDYPLYPYLQYAHLKHNINTVPEREISDFLSRYAQMPLASPLRERWLLSLARQGRWHKFVQKYRPKMGSKLACYNLQARIKNTGRDKALSDHALLDDIKAMWLVGRSQLNECDPAFDVLYESQAMNADLIWQRIGLAMQEGQLGLAKSLSGRLNEADQQKVVLWRNLHTRPYKYLQHENLLADTPLNRKMVLHGVKRLAKSDVGQALIRWTRLQEQYQFSVEEKNSIEQTLTFEAVDQQHPEASVWLDALQERTSSHLVQRYMLRCAILNKKWTELERWTRKPPVPEFNQLRWLFWRARALEETEKKDAARIIYRDLATERDYYGFLAAERIGEGYRYNDKRLPLLQEQRTELLANLAVVRARELYDLEMYKMARGEWSYVTRHMDVEQLKNAAVLAYEWGWYDRTIITLGQAKAYDDLERRFPTPYKSLVTKYAEKQWLPRSIVYTIMRSESAFMHDARSWAGARGLMQVMPATSRETAKKIAYPYKNTRQLYEPETNIALGTAYLKQMLNRYDNRLILAAAAYNAGPQRVHKWRPENGCVAANEWVELIPFTETRRYVRRALFYSVLYQSRLGEKVEPITSHLEPVPAQGKACS